ncbi:hypothetical protein [Turicibacter sanguinis]|uniref:hypothetical protein n=1 Tax=Turicibacter sanguinis TaxID=154288 RepID=UPI0039928FF9
MSKIRLSLSYKNVLILKHSLEERIEIHESIWEKVGRDMTPENPLYEMYLKEEKENEEHKRCLEALIKEMATGGYRYVAGQESNIFGDKYLEKYKEQFKK